MRRAIHSAAQAALAAVCLPAACLLLAGCQPLDPNAVSPALLPANVAVVRVRVLDFDQARIQGIRIHRRDELTAEFEATNEIEITAPFFEAGKELVEYKLFDPEGNPLSVPLAAVVEREGTAATLAFWYVRFEPPGSFKASVFNLAGESNLSNESMSM
jgi:hypothetical protein